MGFSVDPVNMLVTVDHSHNHFCVTVPEGNPVVIIKDGLKITSIFGRTKGKKNKSPLGDNSPMLYALKGMHGLTTRRCDIAMLHASFRKILPIYLQSGFVWDWIVPLPSSSTVCERLAKKVHSCCGIGIIQSDVLIKISAQQAMNDISNLSILAKDRAILSSDIRRFIRDYSANDDFQMKYARTQLRHHVNPLQWGRVIMGSAPPRRVLLIDDMVTSGSSLLSAKKIIHQYYPMASIEALTLFGSSK